MRKSVQDFYFLPFTPEYIVAIPPVILVKRVAIKSLVLNILAKFLPEGKALMLSGRYVYALLSPDTINPIRGSMHLL